MGSTGRYAFGPFIIDGARRILSYREQDITLTGKAFDLLLEFVTSDGAALGRNELFERLWPNVSVEDGNLSQHVYLIRRALDPGGGKYIETIARFGYRFSEPVTVLGERPPKIRSWQIRWQLAFALIVFAVVTGAFRFATNGEPLTQGARDSYLLAQYHLHLRVRGELAYAGTYFSQTIDRSPKNAAGYAGLAAVRALDAEFESDGSARQRRDIELAKRYCDLALSRDSANADALAAAGFIAYRFENDPVRAQTLLTAAIAADPKNSAARHWHGVLLLVTGCVKPAVEELEAARDLDPSSEVFLRWLARAYVYDGRPREALATVNDLLRIQPGSDIGRLIRASAQEELGDLHGAVVTLRDVDAREAWERQFTTPDEARIEARLGTVRRATLVKRVEAALATGAADPFESSLFFSTIGRRDRADALLLQVRPSFVTAGLDRNDPRLRAIVSLNEETGNEKALGHGLEFGSANGSRTRLSALKGPRPNR